MFIFPRPLKQEIKSGDFCFSQKVYLHLSEKNADKNFAALYKELWSGFTAGLSALEFVCDVSDDGIAVLTVSDELPRLNKSDLNGYEYIVDWKSYGDGCSKIAIFTKNSDSRNITIFK